MHIKRVNTILTYIDSNLSDNLSLKTIAKIAFYSPFHFHRLFKSITNETLNSYVTRKRIEKAASLLMHKKDVSISEIVLQFGFSSNSAFTRAFKKYYGHKVQAILENPIVIHFARLAKRIARKEKKIAIQKNTFVPLLT